MVELVENTLSMGFFWVLYRCTVISYQIMALGLDYSTHLSAQRVQIGVPLVFIRGIQ